MGRRVSTDRLTLHILASLPRVSPQPLTESCRDRQGLKTLQASSQPEQYSAVQACSFLSRHWPLRKTAQEWAEPLSLGFVQQKLYLSMLQDFLHACLLFMYEPYCVWERQVGKDRRWRSQQATSSVTQQTSLSAFPTKPIQFCVHGLIPHTQHSSLSLSLLFRHREDHLLGEKGLSNIVMWSSQVQ